MEFETIKIFDGQIEKEIYILLDINKEHHYIIYTDKILNKLDKENIYIGEIIQNQLFPVNEETLKYYNQLIDEINEKYRGINEQN